MAGTKRANPQIRLVQPGIPRRTVCAPSTLEPLAWSGPRQTSGTEWGIVVWIVPEVPGTDL